jgi:cytochrome c5
MSDKPQEHESFIKTPGQLIAVVVLAFVVFIAIAALASQLAASGRVGAPSPEATAKLIAPVAKLEVGAAEAVAKGARAGEQVYLAACAACHDSGAAGAPKTGDAGAWSARLSQGLEGLVKSAIAGKGAMPARGGNPDLTDQEIARAVVLMANKSGANFKEPAAQ